MDWRSFSQYYCQFQCCFKMYRLFFPVSQSFLICVYTVCMNEWSCIHTRVREGVEILYLFCLTRLSSFMFWGRVAHWNWNSATVLGKMSTELQESICFSSSVRLRLPAYTSMPSFWCGLSGSLCFDIKPLLTESHLLISEPQPFKWIYMSTG